MTEIYDTTRCTLGEGPLWHPLRKTLFWFDIEAYRLISHDQVWQFDEYVSAAGWVDHDMLLIASESQLFRFDLETQDRKEIAALEADNPKTRSNDGRADPQGGFWIGTMGKSLEPGLGAIYRWYRGELRKLYADISISNSICFAPDGKTAYFCDTPTKKIMQVTLDAQGWPDADPQIAVDLTATGENPDGSVVDADGNIWNAQWGASRVACYNPKGALRATLELPAAHITCPAFAGETGIIYATSATQMLGRDAIAQNPHHGMTFVATVDAIGQNEHQVIL